MGKFEFQKHESKNVQRTVRLDRHIDADLQVLAAEAEISVPKAIAQILEKWAILHPLKFKEYRKHGR